MFRLKKIIKGISILCCLMTLILPIQAQAGIGLSFDLISFGPFSIGIDIPLAPALALVGVVAAGAALISFFSRGSGGYSYAASHPSGEPPTTHVRVTVNPEDHYKGDALRIRLKHHKVIDDNHRIALPKKGFLEVQYDTGKMVFRGVEFDGYMYFHYNRSLTVWDNQNNPILVLTRDDDNSKLLILQEKSEKAARVLELVLGRTK